MEVAAVADSDGKGSMSETSLLFRVYRVLKMLVSMQARLARREAREGVRRMMTAVVLAAIACALLSMALLLGHAALVMAIEQHYGLGYPASIGAVAGGDVVLALFLFLVARARMAAPILPETREMVKKAAAAMVG